MLLTLTTTTAQNKKTAMVFMLTRVNTEMHSCACTALYKCYTLVYANMI